MISVINYRLIVVSAFFALGLIACTGSQDGGSIDNGNDSVSLSAASSSSEASTSSSSLSSANPSSANSSSSSDASSSSSGVAFVHTIIQENDQHFCPFSGVVEAQHAGFTGDGYANATNAAGAKLTWAIEVGTAGRYTIDITYSNGSMTERPAIIATDGLSETLSFPSTAEWSIWQSEQQEVELSAGTHMLTLTPQSAAGLANIDSLTLTGTALVSPASCPRQEPINVWLAGDSTVANGNTPCPVGWGKTFGELFNDKVTVRNYAVGGRSVRTWLYDVTNVMGSNGECVVNSNNGNPVLQDRWRTVQAQMQPGDYLFIQFGINDGARTCPRHVGTGAFKEEYRMMANAALARGAFPVLVTPAPAIKCSGSTAVASRGYISEVFEVGNELNIPVIDLHRLGTELYNQLAFCPVEGGDVSAATRGAVGEFFCDDHTHFDTPGARQIGRVIANALAAQAIPLADYLNEGN